MFYNIKVQDMNTTEWSRIILFMGESAQVVQSQINELLFVGGFMGSEYNFKIGAFKLEYMDFYYHRLLQFDTSDEKAVSQGQNLGRMGHLAFWDHTRSHLIMFGGQKASGGVG